MNKLIGYNKIEPRIKAVKFLKEKFELHLVDGRIVIIPSSKFPEIKKLTALQKRNYRTLAGLGLMFDDVDTVFHVSDFMGNAIETENAVGYQKQKVKTSVKKTVHHAVAEPSVKYQKRVK